jgi:hypothetical protein
MANEEAPMNTDDKKKELDQIIASAKRLGIELDEEEAIQWLTAIAMAQDDSDIQVDVKSGVYGHKVTMLDFSPQELAHFRRIGALRIGSPVQDPALPRGCGLFRAHQYQSRYQASRLRYPGRGHAGQG